MSEEITSVKVPELQSDSNYSEQKITLNESDNPSTSTQNSEQTENGETENGEGEQEVEVVKKSGIRKKFRYYENYISKILKKISEKSEITLSSRQQLNHFIIILSKKISTVAIELTEISKKKTVSEKEVKNAVRIIMNDDLSSSVIAFAEESVKNFSSDQGLTRQSKAGIIFPPSISEKFLRRWGNSNIMVSSTSPVVLASVIEYIVTEILEDAHLNAVEQNRVRITIRDMELSVRNNNNIRDLFVNNNIEFLGGGVVPSLHNNIKYDKNGERTNISWCIESYQNTGDCLMFAKHPFEQVLRGIISGIKLDTKVSSEVMTFVQYYIEQWLVDLLQKANNMALYSGRLKVVSSDIEIVLSVMENRTPFFFKKN